MNIRDNTRSVNYEKMKVVNDMISFGLLCDSDSEYVLKELDKEIGDF